MSAAVSNKVFTYKEALKKEDYWDFIKAMEKDMQDPNVKDNLTLIWRDEMPSDTKMIMSFEVSKERGIRMEHWISIRLKYMITVEYKLGE